MPPPKPMSQKRDMGHPKTSHVSEARPFGTLRAGHGAPDFVTHFRSGATRRRRVVAIQRRADESLRLRLHSCLRQRGSAYRRSLYGTAEAVPFRIGGSAGGLLARRRNAGILSLRLRMTSKNRQRQGQRPGLKPVSSMGMGLPRLKPGPISGTKTTARANTKADSLRE